MTLGVTYTGWETPELFKTQLSGAYNCLNILAAIAIGVHFGIEIENLKQGIFQYMSTNNRSQVIEQSGKQIWLDAYNAKPASMRAAIAHICSIPNKKVALILGDMFEMGEHSEAEHAGIGTYINQFSPTVTILIGNDMKFASEKTTGQRTWFQTVEEARQELTAYLDGIDLILSRAQEEWRWSGCWRMYE